MKKILFVLFALTLIAFAQDKNSQNRNKDAFKEMEEGKLTLRFNDALTGKPIKGGKVTISETNEYETDYEGRIFIDIDEEKEMLPIVFEHPKYITTQMEIELMAGTLFLNHFSISPKMPVGSIRVILDWGDSPRDLDAHFVKDNAYHISFRKMIISADGVAKLDRDDTDGKGPETITVSRVDADATYKYFVHDFTNQNNVNSDNLSKSRAMVRVYGDNKLLYNLNIGLEGAGNYWNVFDVVNGEIKVKNQLHSMIQTTP